MPPALALITLLTDFGERDYFVASMKGVILTVHPAARIVDLSHQIAPHGVEEAGYLLESCYRYFPEGTIHVAVVDPGVGTARRALLVSTPRCYFIAPDNGLLTRVMAREPDAEIRQIENAQYRLPSSGSTFDGRDVFAPAAAWLSKGASPASFGRLLHDPVHREIPQPRWEQQRLIGCIVYIDRFGNLISNVTARHVSEWRVIANRPHPVVHIGGRTINGLAGSYRDGALQAPGALINSNDCLEVFVREGSAADLLGLSVGEPVALE